jgi:hypothetical protein
MQTLTAFVFGTLLCGAYGGVIIVLQSESPSAALLCILYFLIGQGGVGLYFVVLTPNAGNFAIKHRATMIAVILAVWISASLFR